MRKLVLFFCTLLLTATLTGCGKTEQNIPSATSTPIPTNTATPIPTPTNTPTPTPSNTPTPIPTPTNTPVPTSTPTPTPTSTPTPTPSNTPVPTSTPTPKPTNTPTPKPTKAPEPTAKENEIFEIAQKLITEDGINFSYTLVDYMLENYDYTEDEIIRAVYRCSWKEETLEIAINAQKAWNISKEALYNYMLQDDIYRKYLESDIRYAVENCNADWNASALCKAKDLMKSPGYTVSYGNLYKNLKELLFTEEQIQYALDNCGNDWYKEALSDAKAFTDACSYQYIYEQLLKHGHSEDIAKQALNKLDADWYQRAVNAANLRLGLQNYSYQELYNTLITQAKFTEEQAQYGVDHCNASWTQ